MGKHGQLRHDVWQALAKDDAGKLKNVLKQHAEQKKMHISELVCMLQMWLWKQDGGNRRQLRSLLAAAAGNIKGVPPETGAVNCVKFLVAEFSWTESDIIWCYNKAVEYERYKIAEFLEYRVWQILKTASLGYF